MRYWAHSDPDGLGQDEPGARWQPLADHLRNVSRLARRFAEYAAPQNRELQELAASCGLLHDFGKYTDCFQDLIRAAKVRCPHAAHGAALVMPWREERRQRYRAYPMALAIAGHHGGLADWNALEERISEHRQQALALMERAKADLPELESALKRPIEIPPAKFDLFTRMLFSCLVDADRLDTAGRTIVQAPLEAETWLRRLLDEIDGLAARCAEPTVRDARRAVLENCLAAAEWPERLLSLSVPTGGGKTLSAMAYALKRAAGRPEYRRVIVVIPYLSIIEQNAEVYAEVFGSDAVLEHHSGSFVRLKPRDEKHFVTEPEPEDEYLRGGWRPETENWDAPLIVTTSVRFFESLFSNHPSDLRRVHNIARSIVILDEVQVLPPRLLGALLGMIEELATQWGCTFVFSTATQPAFEKGEGADKRDLRWRPGTLREIVQSPASLHRRLRRVTIEWRIEESVDWPEVAGWMLKHEQALCVVNLREHAAGLYEELKSRAPIEGLFHLSTRMCAAHRLDVLRAIRERLLQKQLCRVVSTQLIEAGVDLDFPIAFRALGPLDAVMQVAGRADREGRLTGGLGAPGGRLIVFKPVDHRMPPNEYHSAAGITEAMAKRRVIQPDDIDAMHEFFEQHYGDQKLGPEFVEMRKKAKFESLAKDFEIVNSRTQDVFVPYGEGKQLIEELRSTGRLHVGLRRRLQRFTVGLHPWEFEKARAAGLEELLPRGSNVWIAGSFLYDEAKGLTLDLRPDAFVI